MTKTTETKAPTMAAYHVRDGKGENAKSFWTRIGAAWVHQDGEGMTLQLDCLPVDGRVVIRPLKADEQDGSAA